MPVTLIGLKALLQSKVGSLSKSDKTQPLKALGAYADGICEYLKSNLSITGIYIGVVASVPPTPDSNGPAPLGLPYTFDVDTFDLTGQIWLDSVTGMTTADDSFIGWKTMLETAISGIVFKTTDSSSKVTLSTAQSNSTFSLGIKVQKLVDGELVEEFIDFEQSMMLDVASYTDYIDLLSKVIIDSIEETIVVGLSKVAHSITPNSQGTVTFVSLI